MFCNCYDYMETRLKDVMVKCNLQHDMKVMSCYKINFVVQQINLIAPASFEASDLSEYDVNPTMRGGGESAPKVFEFLNNSKTP